MEDKMMSLYDYLGYAAGAETGKQVYAAASAMKVPVDTRHVSNARYTGEVMLYPEGFLKEYFDNKQNG